MATGSKKELLKKIKQRKYLNKDFDGFKQDLLEYAKTYFPDNIKDFSETSFGGLFLELAAYVGDVQSFYLDHQFHEMNPATATESANIETHLTNAGVPVVGASPAVVDQTFLIEIKASNPTGEQYVPNSAALPIISAGCTVKADNGTQFELVEDIDFTELNANGDYTAEVTVGNRDVNNNPTTFIMSKNGQCISGFTGTDTFSVGSFSAFKKITLSKENVTEITRVYDNQGNDYYEVEYLTQDTVFERLKNLESDNGIVKDAMTIKPAPFRFISNMSLNTRLTTLTFGGGSAESLDDDIIPDPSEFAIPLYGKRNFSRFTLNPNNLLQTTTLGVIAPNSIITVEYRYGGGLSHNAGPRSIRGISSATLTFPNSPSAAESQFVRSSLDSVNIEKAAGGEDAPTITELKGRIPAIKASQSRIVTKEDLLARIYTMPSNFGRVFRAAVHKSSTNPLATELFIVSRDSDGKLTTSPDKLKENLSTFINEYRLTNDAVDILDARIINLVIDFSITAEAGVNKQLVKQLIIEKIKQYFSTRNFEIDQPLMLNDIENVIYNNIGVMSVSRIEVKNISGEYKPTSTSTPRSYSGDSYELVSKSKIIYPPKGGIFEIKYSEFDIRGIVQ